MKLNEHLCTHVGAKIVCSRRDPTDSDVRQSVFVNTDFGFDSRIRRHLSANYHRVVSAKDVPKEGEISVPEPLKF